MRLLVPHVFLSGLSDCFFAAWVWGSGSGVFEIVCAEGECWGFSLLCYDGILILCVQTLHVFGIVIKFMQSSSLGVNK